MEEKKFLDSDHKCARCGVIYKMIENVGKYNCLQHTGYITSNGVFSCCGVHANNAIDVKDYYRSGKCRGTSRDLGCNPCSHVSKVGQSGTFVYNEDNGYFQFHSTTIEIFGSKFNPEEIIMTENADENKVYKFVKMFKDY